MNDSIENVRDCVRKIHEQFEDDLRRGDAKATAMFGMLGGEMNAARKSLGLSPLPKGQRDETNPFASG